uniref:CMP/dCMP-type deaminase domain-containing protein n=1 Tax=Oryza nivara TaxID=4536 RepID=A0A0E0GXR8_ORYNI
MASSPVSLSRRHHLTPRPAASASASTSTSLRRSRLPVGCAAAGLRCQAQAGDMDDDGVYIRGCVELARKAAGHTSPNPMVGCVVVRGGRVVGEGFHPEAGQPHAEVFALRDAGDLAENATAYVSLEPCNHYGRTPPCTEALINAKVKDVVVMWGLTYERRPRSSLRQQLYIPASPVRRRSRLRRADEVQGHVLQLPSSIRFAVIPPPIPLSVTVVDGMTDPNPIVASKGIERLQSAGIDVRVCMEEEALCRKLNEAYIHRMLAGKAFATLRTTLSMNGVVVNQIGTGADQPGGYYSQLLKECDGVIIYGISANMTSFPTSHETGAKQPLYIIIAQGEDSQLNIPFLKEECASEAEEKLVQKVVVELLPIWAVSKGPGHLAFGGSQSFPLKDVGHKEVNGCMLLEDYV